MLKPNEDCWCGSTRKYKNCHSRIDGAQGAQKYIASQEVYARNWAPTAEFHYKNGVYRWLSEQVADRAPKRILDIGCGSGHGLLALREVLGADVEIIAIDENPACLAITQDNLRRHAGLTASLIKRLTVSETPLGYSQSAAALEIADGAPVTLIESDVCNDPALAAALQATGPFDLVTNWLTGVHMLRQSNADVRRSGVTSDGAHRLYVQNATYELADTVLAAGGYLQIADRGETPSNDLLIEDIRQAHNEQAAPTSLSVKAITHRVYDEPLSRRTPMGLTPGKLGLQSPGPSRSVISIVSTKA